MKRERGKMNAVTRYTSRGTVFLLLTVHCLLFTVYGSLFTDAYALDVQREVLQNGLTLMTVERHNLPLVKVAVGVRAGSVIEPEAKAGLANLTAELLTSGTGKRTASQINEETDFVGASLSASGGDDYITITLSVLKKDIDLGFDLLSDIMLNPSFPEQELNKKRERIKGSLKSQEESPGFVASREFRKAVFGHHPYGRLVQGTPESLDSITAEDISSFHRAYYVPNNSIMSVVGDISSGEVNDLLRRYFPDWKSGHVHSTVPPLPENKSKRETITKDRDLTQANIILGHEGISRDNPDYYAVLIMNYILGGGGFESRLMQNIREQKGLAYDVHSYFDTNKYGGAFEVRVQTKNESANTAIGEILKEMERIRTLRVSDSELNDAKSFLTGSFPLRLETGSRIANFLVAVEYYGLGMDYIDRYSSYINAVSKDDVLRAAQKYLDPVNFTLVVVADQKKAMLNTEFRKEHSSADY